MPVERSLTVDRQSEKKKNREKEGGKKKKRRISTETSVARLKGGRTSPIRKFRPCYFRSIRGSRAGEISFLRVGPMLR